MVSPEVKISGSFTYVNISLELIRLLARGVIDGQAGITNKITVEDTVEKGFEALTKNRSQYESIMPIHKASWSVDEILT